MSDGSDCFECQVLGHYTAGQCTVKSDAYALRHLQPDFTCNQDAQHLRGADAGGKCAECAIGTGVGVGPNGQLAGRDTALLYHDLVARACKFIIVINVMFGGPFPGEFYDFGLGGIGRRGIVVRNDGDPLRVPNLGAQQLHFFGNLNAGP